MAEPRCTYCGTDEAELRPYGPGGSWTCFPCMKASPDREDIAHNAFGVLLDGSAAMSPVDAVFIGEQDGPRPFLPTPEENDHG